MGIILNASDIQTLLSARTFLKVLQEFDALPHEEAVEKLYEFNRHKEIYKNFAQMAEVL